MEILQLIAVLFGATGFWKALEVSVRFITGRKKQIAETKHLAANAETQIVNNWVQWSKKLEERVKELEAMSEENKHLKEQIESQRQRIGELEDKVQRMEQENQALHVHLQELTQSQPPAGHE